MRHELRAYDEELPARPFAVVGTKLDAQGDGTKFEQLRAYCERRHLTFMPVSAATREGLDDLIQFIGRQVDTLRKAPCETKS